MEMEDFLRLLKKLPDEIDNLNHAPALEDATDEVFESVDRNFGRQTDSDGELWPPRKDILPHPLLILTGAMKEAATGGPGSFIQYSRRDVKLGVRAEIIPYAARHQYGEDPVPRREYFYINIEDRGYVLDAFGEREYKIFTEFLEGW